MTIHEGRSVLLLRRTSVGVLVAILLMLAYFLSAGPVFAFCKYREDDPYGVTRYFDPLIYVAPEATSKYLNWWGVSDIEAFFLRASRETGGFGHRSEPSHNQGRLT